MRTSSRASAFLLRRSPSTGSSPPPSTSGSAPISTAGGTLPLPEQRLTALRVPLDRPVHSLSGGQRAQVALSLALAKRPRVLLLDEPLAALDPLARREFLTSLAEVTVEGDVTVVLSSHLVHDLERVCNHLILLSASRVRLCADIDDVLGGHRVLVGPRRSTAELERLFTVVKVTHTERQSRVLARLDGPVLDPAWAVSEVGLEDIILAYMSENQAVAAGPLSLAGGTA